MTDDYKADSLMIMMLVAVADLKSEEGVAAFDRQIQKTLEAIVYTKTTKLKQRIKDLEAANALIEETKEAADD